MNTICSSYLKIWFIHNIVSYILRCFGRISLRYWTKNIRRMIYCHRDLPEAIVLVIAQVMPLAMLVSSGPMTAPTNGANALPIVNSRWMIVDMAWWCLCSCPWWYTSDFRPLASSMLSVIRAAVSSTSVSRTTCAADLSSTDFVVAATNLTDGAAIEWAANAITETNNLSLVNLSRHKVAMFNIYYINC